MIDIIHTFNVFKRFFKNIQPFFSSSRNTFFTWNIIFRHIGTKWCSLCFFSLEFGQGHMTVPGYCQQLKHHLKPSIHPIDPRKFTRMPCRSYITKARYESIQRARNLKMQRPHSEFCRPSESLTHLIISKIKATHSPQPTLFSPCLRSVRVVRGKRKQTLITHMMVILRLLSNQNLITSMPSCKRPKLLQQRKRERNLKSGQKDTKVIPREPWGNARKNKKFLKSKVTAIFSHLGFMLLRKGQGNASNHQRRARQKSQTQVWHPSMWPRCVTEKSWCTEINRRDQFAAREEEEESTAEEDSAAEEDTNSVCCRELLTHQDWQTSSVSSQRRERGGLRGHSKWECWWAYQSSRQGSAGCQWNTKCNPGTP